MLGSAPFFAPGFLVDRESGARAESHDPGRPGAVGARHLLGHLALDRLARRGGIRGPRGRLPGHAGPRARAEPPDDAVPAVRPAPPRPGARGRRHARDARPHCRARRTEPGVVLLRVPDDTRDGRGRRARLRAARHPAVARRAGACGARPARHRRRPRRRERAVLPRRRARHGHDLHHDAPLRGDADAPRPAAAACWPDGSALRAAVLAALGVLAALRPATSATCAVAY